MQTETDQEHLTQKLMNKLTDIALSKNVNQTVHLPKVSLPVGALFGHRTEFVILKADSHQFCLGMLLVIHKLIKSIF